ncbi:MAG: YhdP family phospholipid transporter, partial [bacterium]
LVRGNLRDVEIDSIRKAPASRNINGYFEATTRGGLLELSSPSGLAIWYPTAYDDYMEHGSVTGRVDWLLDKEVGALKLNSGPLAISGEDGQGVAYLALNIPFNRAEGAGDMYLQVGVRDSHSRYRHQYIPRTLKPELAKWLDDAIGDAVVNEMGFIWRGSLAKTEQEKRSLQLYFNVESADLAFQSDWPALKNADAIVTVDGGAAEGTVTAGVLKDLNVQSASFRLVQSTPEKPLHVRVEGDVRGDASEALAFLLASPVSNRILALSEWRSGGDLSATVDLEIPLIGGYEPRILVRATANNGELSDPSETLVLDRINTDLVYDSQRGGLFADRFSARLWGDSSVRGALATDDQGIRISSSSKVSAKTLERIFQWPLDPLITGTALVSSDIRIPADGSPVTLKLDSDMAGLSSTLPAPFGKTSDSKLPAHLSLTFGEQWQYDFTLSQEEISSHLTGVLRTVDGKLASGIITLGGDEGEGGVPAGEEKVEGEQADDGQLKVLGHLDRVDLNQWMPVFKHFAENAAQSGNFAPDLSLAVDEFTVGSMAMTAVQLSGGRGAQDEAVDWVFDFTSDIADGSLLLPSDEAGLLPVSLSLHRLTIETDQKSDIEETDEPDVDELSVEAVPPVAAVEESDESDVMIESDVVESSRLASINPGDLPTLNFSVERLEYGDKIFGPLSLNVRPYDSGSSSGVRFERIEGQLGGFEIVSEQVNSSVLDWRVEDGVVTSRFEGVVETGNLGKVMEFWGYPKALESKSANFIAELGWSGAPDQFSLENLDGLITLGIQDGKFNRTSGSAADAMMRMVGLFNFANWVRRLRLDFSDVLGSGMSFDEMTGGLRFSRGQLAFDDPIEVKLPSGRMRLSGTANLVDESLDANLVMTVPVATNLPWIAALAGGLPAAAGVYLTSKVFEKEVDKLSSFNYSLKGDWADPEIRVEKIFSD